jgi:hypothetical protein
LPTFILFYRIAGSDTTTISLSYFFWELSRRADIIRKLQAELDQAMPDPHVIPDISVLQNLPYLNAFIKEGAMPHWFYHFARMLNLLPIGLRVHGSTPSLLERVIPSFTSKNGSTNESFDLMGYALPPGTIVATQAWSMHRDSSVFPSPSTFLPDRWLETSFPDNTEQLNRMQQHFMPFGTGSRGCGGQNLAMMMLRIVVAAIARNFDTIAPAETNDKSMKHMDSFVCFCFGPLFNLRAFLTYYYRFFSRRLWSASSISGPAFISRVPALPNAFYSLRVTSSLTFCAFLQSLTCSFNL